MTDKRQDINEARDCCQFKEIIILKKMQQGSDAIRIQQNPNYTHTACVRRIRTRQSFLCFLFQFVYFFTTYSNKVEMKTLTKFLRSSFFKSIVKSESSFVTPASMTSLNRHLSSGSGSYAEDRRILITGEQDPTNRYTLQCTSASIMKI